MIVRTHAAGQIHSTAVFSDCERYRYSLVRRWSSRPLIVYLLMNPSTATEIENDATIERCQRRADAWDRTSARPNGGICILNAFAYRETDSRKLPGLVKQGFDIIGADNDKAIEGACRGAEMVICGWGRPGNLLGRGAAVLGKIRQAGAAPMALGINADGSPKHPLYCSYETQPVPMP